MYQLIENISIQRRFVNLDSRQVHYRISGAGPVLLLLHQSPTSSAEKATIIEDFANDFTVIAPDTPGFGLSDYIETLTPDITLYAEALKEFTDALGLDQICIYGFHTGAIIAAEMARLYPDLCNAVVVNGLVVLEPDEEEKILRHYTQWFTPTPEGTHLPWVWARIREQLIFFPWFQKEKEVRLNIDLPDPKFMQPYVLDLLRSTAESQTAYQAAFMYPSRERIQEINTPTFLLNYAGDPIAEHPKRLKQLSKSVTIELLPDTPSLEDRAREIFKQFSNESNSALNQDDSSMNVGRKNFVQTSKGPLFYYCDGDETDEIMLVLHDFSQSSKSMIHMSDRFNPKYRKIFIDLPGHGETGPTHLTNYSPQSIMQMIVEALKAIEIKNIEIASLGVSSSIALLLSQHTDLNVKRLLLIEPWCLNKEEREDFSEHYAPDLSPSVFGEHLLKAWYFIRDSELFFPWHQTKESNALKREPDIDPSLVHERTVDALKSGEALKLVAKDLIGYDIQPDLANIKTEITIFSWIGNGKENYAEKMNLLLENSTIEFLPDDKSMWSID